MALRKITLFIIAGWVFCHSWPAMAAVSGAPVNQNKNDSTWRVRQAAGKLHLPFIENRGQAADPAVAYTAGTISGRVAVTHSGRIAYRLGDASGGGIAPSEIREYLVGPQVKTKVIGRELQTARVSYCLGRDASKWRTGLRTYAKVTLGRAAPGVRAELKAYGRNVEKLFYLQPGADPASIQLAVEGAEAIEIKKNGELELAAASGRAVRFTRPVAYQQIDGHRRMVPVRYRISRDGYGFELGPYDRSKTLVIDPKLVNLTEIICPNGGFGAVLDAVKDKDGNIYAAGSGESKMAVWKMDAKAEKLLSVNIFGPQAGPIDGTINAIALDSHGHVFVAGNSKIGDPFPLTPGCHDTDKGKVLSMEGFVIKLSADLKEILAATFIGGDHEEHIHDIAINKKDQIYIAGASNWASYDNQHFPVIDGSFDTVPSREFKGVIARLDNDLTTVEAATYLGGNTENQAYVIGDIITTMAIDAQGNIWVAGNTNQPDFPVTDGCLDPTRNSASGDGNIIEGDGDVFLSILDPDLKELLVSTYIGGMDKETASDMLFDGKGNLYLLGWTYSTDFPMPAGGYDAEHSGNKADGFVLVLNPTASKMIGGTFLGDTPFDDRLTDMGDERFPSTTDRGDDMPAAMALSPDGVRLAVVGRTDSSGFPTTEGCVQSSVDCMRDYNCGRTFMPRIQGGREYGDGFVSILSSDLTRLSYSTFIGSVYTDYLDAVLFNTGNLIAVGQAVGHGFPMSSINAINLRGIFLHFSTGDISDPDNNGQNPVTAQAASGGGGGGGGCFISGAAISISIDH